MPLILSDNISKVCEIRLHKSQVRMLSVLLSQLPDPRITLI